MGGLNVAMGVNDYAPNGLLSMEVGSPLLLAGGRERGGNDYDRWGMRPLRSFAYDGDGNNCGACKDNDPCQKTLPGRLWRNRSVSGLTSPQPVMDRMVQVEMNRDNRERNRVWWPIPTSTQMADRMPPMFAPQSHARMMMQDELAAAVMASSNPYPTGGA
jgi:hypothetical protein